MDSDLADAVDALKTVCTRRKLPISLGKASPQVIDDLKKQLRVPSRYRSFLAAADPLSVETVTPVERIRFMPSSELLEAQARAKTPPEGTRPMDWKSSWVVIAESALLGDPYFLDVSRPDPEGDCPVYTAMSGQDRWVPTLAASSFAQFLRILSTAMEIAEGFGDAIMDDDDEDNFRQTLAPKVKVIDAAAFRAGHWT